MARYDEFFILKWLETLVYEQNNHITCANVVMTSVAINKRYIDIFVV